MKKKTTSHRAAARRPVLARVCALGLVLASAASTHAQDLFQKYASNPVFTVGNDQPNWRHEHVANVTVLPPAKTKDGKWRLWLRGTGNGHDQIGTFDQPATGFNPYGPWSEYASNPVIRNGPAGSYDEQNCLDAAALAGPNKEVYLYYMGRSASNQSSLNGAVSTDGGFTFSKFASNSLKLDVGPNDAVYANSKYYLYYGDAKYNGHGFDEPLQIWLSQSASPSAMSSTPTYALKVGPGGSFDSFSVNGAKIFKVTGDDRYFMLYQASNSNFDYPNRFHCAYSTDLVTWTKVTNTKPLMQRGDAGAWDQGGIWTGSVFENNGQLYLYYEAWGSYGTASRDVVYYSGGSSRVGVASCSTTSFLNWVKGNPIGSNLLQNPGFEADNAATQTPTGWTTWPGSNGTDADADFTETTGYAGTYRCTHYKASDYEVYTTQALSGLANGTYTLSAWVVGGGGQAAALMSAKNYGPNVPELTKAIPQSGWPNWTQLSLTNIQVTNGSCTIGFYSKASAGQWLSFDKVSLVRTDAAAARTAPTILEKVKADEPSGLTTYPNPTSRTLHLDLGQVMEQVSVEIVSVQGKILGRQAFSNTSQAELDLGSIPNGQLFLRIITATGVRTQKIELNR